MPTGEGNGTPLQYSCLENPMDGGAWKAAVHGVAVIVRYDVNREQSIGDIQVMGLLLLFLISSMTLLVRPRMRDFSTHLRE